MPSAPSSSADIGGPVRYTRSEDHLTVYAITTERPGKTFELKSVVPLKGREVRLLGDNKLLKWTCDEAGGLTMIAIPERLQKESARPCEHARAFKITVDTK